ncbi:MAG TPA: hypothetical protein VM936_03140 [Pyrinomonadaceae bacterium]|nr:hypothetical protein [Pyrinomonadaceae bacterium]
MPEKRSKYDTDPLDPDFVRRTDEAMGGRKTAQTPPDATTPFARPPLTEEPTRRFDEQTPDASYPSVFVPPAYQPPPVRQPFAGFGEGAPPPGADAPPQPGPASPYAPGAGPSRRAVQRLGIPENVANILPYIPFFVGLFAALFELALVPRNETRTRFHAAQGLALQIAVIVGSILFRTVGGLTGSGFGATLFSMAATVFFIVSVVRVWQGKPHHIAPLDDATRWLNEKISPMR